MDNTCFADETDNMFPYENSDIFKFSVLVCFRKAVKAWDSEPEPTRKGTPETSHREIDHK